MQLNSECNIFDFWATEGDKTNLRLLGYIAYKVKKIVIQGVIRAGMLQKAEEKLYWYL